MKLSLKEGELIPASSKVIVENAGKSYEYLLSDLINEEQIEGNFYMEGSPLQGGGNGYGIKGTKEIFPEVYFTLNILSETSGTEETVGTTGNNETPQIPEETANETTAIENVETPEVPVEEQNLTTETSETPTITSSAIRIFNFFQVFRTGNAVLELTTEIQGQTSKNNPFIYTLENGQTAEIKLGSVRTGSNELPDDEVQLEISENQVKISTSYSEIEEGFGGEFIGDLSKEITIELSSLGITPESGELKVGIFYGEEIISLSTVMGEGISSNKTEETLINETFNETNVNEISDLTLKLAEDEIKILKEKFGDEPVEITKAEETNGRMIVRQEIGNYWVENSYDSSLSENELKAETERDRILWLKDLVVELSSGNIESSSVGNLIGSYGIS